MTKLTDAEKRVVQHFHETAALARTYTGPISEELKERFMPKLTDEQILARADLDAIVRESLTAERRHHLAVTAEHRGIPRVSEPMRRYIARMDNAVRQMYGKLPVFVVMRLEEGKSRRTWWAVEEVQPFDGRPETACAIVATRDFIKVGDVLRAKLGDWGD